MKKRITRISVFQSSKVVTILYVVLGFIYTLIGVPLVVFGSPQYKIMGLVYCFMPLIMAVFGFLLFLLFAALYNLVARWVGGFEVEVTTVEEPKQN